jgi:hypothetical protein
MRLCPSIIVICKEFPFANDTIPYLESGLRDIKMPHTISRKKNIYQHDKRLINLSKGEWKLCVVHFLKAE